LYQAEEEEICDLFCYTIAKLSFLYAAPPIAALFSAESR
jgi:hypothetical protein